jgi:hypothetical protein
MREKRFFENALPPTSDEACFVLRRKLMEELEVREWNKREEDIKRIQGKIGALDVKEGKEAEVTNFVAGLPEELKRGREKVLAQTKLDFEKEVEEKGHEIKKSLGALAKTSDSLNGKINDLNNKEKSLNESERYLE